MSSIDPVQAGHRLVVFEEKQLAGTSLGMADLDATAHVQRRHFPELSVNGDRTIVSDAALQGAVKDPVQLSTADRAAANGAERAQVASQWRLTDARVAAPVIVLLQPVSQVSIEIVEGSRPPYPPDRGG